MLRDRLVGKVMSGFFVFYIMNLVMDFDVVVDIILCKVWNKFFIDNVDNFVGFQVFFMMEQMLYCDNWILLFFLKDRYGILCFFVEWKVYQEDQECLWKGLDIFVFEIGVLGLG